MKCSCDMRGLLSFLIIWTLSKKEMSGEEIAREIEKRRGEKPKAGTIYPALKMLKKKGLIKGRKEGKSVIYSLTGEGRRDVRHAMDYFCRAFGDIMKK